MSNEQKDNERWMKEAKRIGATHFLNVCDTFSYDHYPVYVMPGDDLEQTKAVHSVNMQRVYGVYEVMDKAEQEVQKRIDDNKNSEENFVKG